MKITADSNILLRAILADDAEQADEAQRLMQAASLIAIPLPVFCELVWVMKRLYKRHPAEIADALEAILQVVTVVADRPAVDAGLILLRAGGDFADGAIAWQGKSMGGEIFATFDRGGIRALKSCKEAAAEPADLLIGN